MTNSVLTVKLHEEAHGLGDVYYQAMVCWIRDNKDGNDPAGSDGRLALKRSADAYLHALEQFREHLEAIEKTSAVATQLELTATYIELIVRNKRIYDGSISSADPSSGVSH